MACTKKVFKTRKDAKKNVKKLNRLKIGAKPLTNSYYCAECDGYHNTSAPKKSSRDYTRRLNKDNG